MRGATVTLLADRRTPGALTVARALAARLRADGEGRPCALFVDPALAGARGGPRDPGEVTVPLTVPALIGRLPAHGDVVFAFQGPVRQQVIAALDRSGLVVLLTDVAVASLRSAQRTLRVLTEVGYPVDTVEVGVVGTATDAQLADARAALRRGVVHVLSTSPVAPDHGAAYDVLVARARRA